MKKYICPLSFGQLVIESKQIGEDWLITVSGGEKPHIGCCVLSQPRPSLTGDGSLSATSSVVNVIGHKDEALCRMIGEAAAAAKDAVVVCTGGFHVDGITAGQIEELERAVEVFIKEYI